MGLLRRALSSGDWELARSATELLAGCAAPTSLEETRDRLEALTTLLNAARARRAHLVDSAARVTAAKRFQGAVALQQDERQNLVDSVNF